MSKRVVGLRTGLKSRVRKRDPLVTLVERIRRNVPATLRELKVWLLWKNPDGRKVPYYTDGTPRRGALDSEADRARLVDYEEAARALGEIDGCTGVGVALGPVGDRVLSGIDLDDCRPGVQIDQRAGQVIEAAGSYSEISPSSRGVKIFGWGNIGTVGSTSNGLEIYSGARFFAVTGRRIAGKSLSDLQKAAELGRTLYASGIPEGTRNSTLFKYACSVRDSGHSFAAALDAVREYNRKFGQPPLPEAELVTLTSSAFSRPPRGNSSVPGSHLVGPKDARPTSSELTGPPYKPAMIVEGLLPQDAGGFVAPGGTGKSTLILYISVHIILGRKLFDRPVTQKGPVLYVSAEDARNLVLSRLNRICRALNLNEDELEQVRRGFYVEDISTTPARLAKFDQRGGAVVATALADEIVVKYADLDLSLVVLDPTSLIGPGEMTGNDGMAELMRAARGLVSRLCSCVVLVHHVAQIVARGGIQDQYAGRGGTAFADNSRFNCQLIGVTTRQVTHRGSAFLLPADVTDEEIAEGSVLALLLHKLSFEKNDAQPIVLVREGFEFRQVTVTRQNNTPEARAARDQGRLESVVELVGRKLAAGIRLTKNFLANQYAKELAIPRDDVRALVDDALAKGLLELDELPPRERRGGKTQYLRPAGEASS